MPISCVVFLEKDIPLPGVMVLLQCIDDPTFHFQALTNERGEISQWHITGRDSNLETVESIDNTQWRMSFATNQFFGAQTAFPYICVEFHTNHSPNHRVSMVVLDESYAVLHESPQPPRPAEGLERHASPDPRRAEVLAEYTFQTLDLPANGVQLETRTEDFEAPSSSQELHMEGDGTSTLRRSVRLRQKT